MRLQSCRNLLLCGLILGALGVDEAVPEQAGKNPAAEIRRDILLTDGAPEAHGAGARYSKLLRQLAAPDDQKIYGDYYDFGYWSGTSYGGQEDLPLGYWVYIAPNWYIFGEAAAEASARTPRNWGPEQAIGAPDTAEAGDKTTAWASLTPDGQREWIELTYDKPVKAIAVLVHESFNPGAVDHVKVTSADGKQTHEWGGVDPIAAGKDKGVAVIPVSPNFDVSRVRIELDSQKVKGWNEIDAVGLIDEDGVTHWATSATASSTYAEQPEEQAVRLGFGGGVEEEVKP